jgi:hypothetical protein
MRGTMLEGHARGRMLAQRSNADDLIACRPMVHLEAKAFQVGPELKTNLRSTAPPTLATPEQRRSMRHPDRQIVPWQQVAKRFGTDAKFAFAKQSNGSTPKRSDERLDQRSVFQ